MEAVTYDSGCSERSQVIMKGPAKGGPDAIACFEPLCVRFTVSRPSTGGDIRVKRELGLYSVITISLGAMIGSGIFVLPGLAAKIAGPAVILAYVLAGIVVLPAALSKAEMATAMPEAGGTYVFIDKAMGPLMGTVAGLGVWFSLIFKAAFSLVGLGAYLVMFSDAPVKPVALALAGALIVINVAGVKQTAGVQKTVVTGVLLMLGIFIARGIPHVNVANLQPFLGEGFEGLIVATGVIFVSYAGVTKVASIAEEIKDPGRTIPRGILGSVGLMMLIYPVVVLVMVGVVGSGELAGTVVPVADAARAFLGEIGVDVVSAIAVLALISMANAGLLASSRYPFAMSRNALAPIVLQRLSRRSTPFVSIVVTGSVMLLLVAFVPLLELAKLASAFQLLVFSFVNVALIAFRESLVDWYRPTFRSPLYPWTQIFGIVASFGLLTQLGVVPLVGAGGIIVGGFVWYRVFGRSRVSKQSASLDALRVRTTAGLVEKTRERLHSPGAASLLVVFHHGATPDRERAVMGVGLRLLEPGGQLSVAHIDTQDIGPTVPVPDLPAGAEELDVDEHQTRLRRAALMDLVAQRTPELVLVEIPPASRRTRQYIADARWLREHADASVLFFHYRGIREVNTIVIMGSGGPADVDKISLAHRLAEHDDATLRLVHILDEAASEAEVVSVRNYHLQLSELTEVRIESRVERSADLFGNLDRWTEGADLVILGAAAHPSAHFDLSDRIAGSIRHPVLTVSPRVAHRKTLGRRVLERIIY
ncbi:putative amino acid permease YhdG [bacterium BMS3Bbin01]|nr:putative amino acid permease YhdG [bacterium BMS3Bbin01]